MFIVCLYIFFVHREKCKIARRLCSNMSDGKEYRGPGNLGMLVCSSPAAGFVIEKLYVRVDQVRYRRF